MRIGGLELTSVEFPDKAGELQRAGSSSSLVAELGDNYARYHQHLRELLGKRSRPEREEFDTVDAFLEAWAEVQGIVRAEAILRKCAAHRQHGRSLDAPADISTPLVDEEDRLVARR
jgi:hypothetical protein